MVAAQMRFTFDNEQFHTLPTAFGFVCNDLYAMNNLIFG